MLGCPLISWHLCSCDQEHSRAKDLYPVPDSLVQTSTYSVTQQNHHCRITKWHASCSMRLERSSAYSICVISEHHKIDIHICILQPQAIHPPAQDWIFICHTMDTYSTAPQEKSHGVLVKVGSTKQAATVINLTPNSFCHVWKEERSQGR